METVFWAITSFKIASIAFKTDSGGFFMCCVLFQNLFNSELWSQIQKCYSVPRTDTKTQKSEQGVEKELQELFINDEKDQNKDIK